MLTVILTKRVEKEYLNLTEEMQQRVADALKNLCINPVTAGAKQLKGKLTGFWRLRVGHYRIIYEIANRQERIIVLKIGPRKDVYR